MQLDNIAELAKTTPGISITVNLGELIEAIDYCVNSSLRSLEQIISDEKTEKYLSIDKAAELLDVDKSTLWRWSKSSYLVPMSIGGKRRYRLSDINRMLGKDQGKPTSNPQSMDN
jgi:hypothetical protein